MKKASVFLFIILFVLFFSSCESSKEVQNAEISEEQALYALQTAAVVSTENALELFKAEINKTTSFLSSDYQFLDYFVSTIPGLKLSIDDFNSYVKSFYLESYYLFEEGVLNLVSFITFENPLELVNSSNNSITECFYNNYSSQLKDLLNSIFESADTEVFNKITDQYNRWVNIQTFLGDSSYNTYKNDSNIYEWVAQYISEQFISLLAKCEEYYRTTPQAYKDSVAAYVFGIE